MAGKRALLATVVHGLRVDTFARRAARAFGTNTLTVVNYHRVNEPEAVKHFDEGTLDTTPKSFAEQIALLKREFSLLDPRELREHLAGRPWPRRPALVTFDDGYLDNYEKACGILDEQGVKALFFVASDYVTRRRLFWWDRISYLLKHAKNTRFTLAFPQHQKVDVSGGIAAAERQLHTFVKRTNGLDLERFLLELGDAAGVAWTADLERQLADGILMTWDQVRALHAAGMCIGSHTRTHRVLDTLPKEELDAELSGSRQDIESELAHDVWAIAYPVGYSIAHLPSIRAALQRARYEVGFTYVGRVQPLASLDVLGVARLSVCREWNLGRFSAALTFSACR